MLYVDLAINERSIGTIGIHNTQTHRVDPDDDDAVQVKYDVYDLRSVVPGESEVDFDDLDPVDSTWFDREKGAAQLTAHVMERFPESRLN